MAIRILLAFCVVFTVSWFSIRLLPGDEVRVGTVVIDQISTAKPDWVELLNRSSGDIDMSGFLLSDGENSYVFPSGTVLPGSERLVIGRAKHRAELKRDRISPDLFWGEDPNEDWGFGKSKREFVLLVNSESDAMIDFVRTLPMGRGERLERDPAGSDVWYLARGDTRTLIQIPHTGAGEPWSASLRKYPGKLAQASLGFVGFLKKFAESVAAILAALVSISYSIGKLRRRADKDEAIQVRDTSSGTGAESREDNSNARAARGSR